jgi:Arc/MetJ-type ribon-helix-helix transcriptional regulator
MKQRTERFEMRLTPEEAAGIREKSKRYHSVSNFIRMAVNEFSDTDAKTRLELCNDTARLCRKFQDELSWMGSNLNQAVKRANELAVAGLLSESYFKDILAPMIEGVEKMIKAVKSEQADIDRKAIRLRP